MILRLISYDIESDRYRHKLAKRLEAFGFLRIQYSVFCGTHTQPQWSLCWQTIEKLHKKYGIESDKIYVIIISRRMFKNMLCIGPEPGIKMILSEEVTMWV